MIPNHPRPGYRRGPAEPIHHSHKYASLLIPESTAALVEHLDAHVKPHLAPDVSNYAPGRQRAWLEIEAPLGPTRPWRPGLQSARLWPALCAIWHRAYPNTDPDLGLVIHGSTGIEWHRDASYAQAACLLINLGSCVFEIDRDRGSPPGEPRDPVAMQLQPGAVLSFNCKHLHRVTHAVTTRWSIVLWLLKQHPRRWCDPVEIP